MSEHSEGNWPVGDRLYFGEPKPLQLPPFIQRASRIRTPKSAPPSARHYFAEDVFAQLLRIEPVPDMVGQRVHRPCRVTMRDGAVLDCVLVTDVRPIYRRPRVGDLGFALWPSDVARVEPSPVALAPRHIEQITKMGETFMGGTVVGLTFADGRRTQWWIADNIAPAFPPLPEGASVADVIAVKLLSRFETEEWDQAPYQSDLWVCEHL